MRKLILALFAGLVAGVATLAWLVPSGATADSERHWTPPADTIVTVEGNKADGFGIYYYDGSSIFPPTDSEAKAECSEYDRRIDRVRCWVEVKTWYRDLADLKRSLRYVRYVERSE